LCHNLSQKGIIRASDFDWDKTALNMWKCIEKELN